MCFSAQADIVAGLAVTAVGVDAVRQVHHPSDRALGALPVLLGAHLLIEALVWEGLTGDVSAATGRLGAARTGGGWGSQSLSRSARCGGRQWSASTRGCCSQD